MSQDNVYQFQKPTNIVTDELSELLRSGARRLLEQAVQTELSEFLEQHADRRMADGRQAVVRNGFHPEREIQTGIGAVEVRVPKVRDREQKGACFRSELLPPYLRRSQSMEAVLPWLYLKGVSTGDFQEALSALLGQNAKGLSASTISRLKSEWEQEYDMWSKRSLRGKRYVYLWADGVYFNIRLEESRQCMLVLIAVDEYGKKEFLAVEDGYRESEQSWTELLVNLKQRGLDVSPKLGIGDGALGFWKALRKVYPETQQQRCWVHKMANVLNKLPKSLQPKAKADLHQIWMADTRDAANNAFDSFVDTYQLKYNAAAQCLAKDRDELLAFYDFPAEHWCHIRSTNAIESVFATIRLRTAKTRGCISRKSGLVMVYKLTLSAETRWKKIRGFKRLGEVIQGVRFINGVREQQDDNSRIAA